MRPDESLYLRPQSIFRRSLLLSVVRPVVRAVLLFVFVVVRAVQPLLRVRVGKLRYRRIGPLALNTELCLRRQWRGQNAGREIHVFVTGKPANRQLLRMIRRRMWVIENPLVLQAYEFLRARHPVSDLWIEIPANGNEYDEINNIPPQLAFTAEEISRGKQLLARIGVEPGVPFVCFHARDKAYLNAVHNGRSCEEWACYDHRDSNIENYLLAAEYLASLGLFGL